MKKKTATGKERGAYKKYSKIYYYIRGLYFSGRLIRDGRVIHTYTINEISQITRKEFSEVVLEGTIRQWASRIDKDFKRTWVQEWNKKLKEGKIKAFNEEKEEKEDVESPMQKLVNLQKRSTASDVEIVTGIDQLIKMAIKEVIERYNNSGKVDKDTGKITNRKLDMETIKALMAYNAGPKARITSIKDFETDLEQREKLGSVVTISDVEGRKRIRSAFKEVLKLVVDTNKKEKILSIS